jgi:hypothetical protein
MMNMYPEMWVVVIGDIVDGISTIEGPFEIEQEADAWAEDIDGYNRVVKITPPDPKELREMRDRLNPQD